MSTIRPLYGHSPLPSPQEALGEFIDKRGNCTRLYCIGKNRCTYVLHRIDVDDQTIEKTTVEVGMQGAAVWLATHGCDVPEALWVMLRGVVDFDQNGKPIIPALDSAAPPTKPAGKPSWDGNKLEYNGIVLKQFKRHPAANQRKLLDAFQAAGWTQTIQNPWHDGAAVPLRILNETLRAINRTIASIRFEGLGNGQCRWIEV